MEKLTEILGKQIIPQGLSLVGSKHTWLAISYLLLINNVPEIKKIAAHVMTHKTNTNFFWLCPEQTLAVDEK